MIFWFLDWGDYLRHHSDHLGLGCASPVFSVLWFVEHTRTPHSPRQAAGSVSNRYAEWKKTILVVIVNYCIFSLPGVPDEAKGAYLREAWAKPGLETVRCSEVLELPRGGWAQSSALPRAAPVTSLPRDFTQTSDSSSPTWGLLNLSGQNCRNLPRSVSSVHAAALSENSGTSLYTCCANTACVAHCRDIVCSANYL